MEQKNHSSPSFINITILLLFAIVIVVASSVTTYFFLGSKSNEQPSTISKELEKVANKVSKRKNILKIRVTNWIGKRPIENLSVEVIWRDNHKVIYKNKTDKNSIVEFSLPAGFYYYRVAEKDGMGYRSGEDGINLEKDTEVELRTILMPPQ